MADFQVTVTALSGTVVTWWVNEDFTVRDLQKYIKSEFQIPRKLQKLVYADECLQADAYLVSFIQRTLPVWFVLADIVPVRSYAKYFSAVKVDLVVEAPECAHCGLRSEHIMYCGGCRSVVYCSPVCQAAQWSVHKHACKIRPGSHEA
jgi:hypothetical protein